MVRRRPRWPHPTLPALLLLVTGCAGAGAAPPSAPVPRAAPAPAALEPSRLLPAHPDRVLWYEARDGASVRRVALFRTVEAGLGPVLESLGLARDGAAELRLWSAGDRVVVLPGGLHRPLPGQGYVAWRATVPAAAGEPRQPAPPPASALQLRGLQPVTTAAGSFQAVVTEAGPRAGGLRVRHWLVRDLGLVRLEVLPAGAGQPSFTLELVEVAPRGGAPADASTPERAWQALEEAVRRLDAGAIEALSGPRLGLARGRAAVRDLAPPGADEPGPGPDHDPEAERLHRLVPGWLELSPRIVGPWRVAGDVAQAPARVRLDPAGEPVPAVITLARAGDGWRWEGLEVLPPR